MTIRRRIRFCKSTRIALASGELITWSEFASSCRAINAACQNNLIVATNMCYGIWAIRETSVRELTSSFALIGPRTTVQAQEADAMSLFYRSLMNTGDFEAALTQLPHSLEYFLCERAFVRAYSLYLRQKCRGRGRRERNEQLLTSVRQIPALSHIPIGEARRITRARAAPCAEAFERAKARYLMSDHPDNRGRFSSSFEQACRLAGLGER